MSNLGIWQNQKEFETYEIIKSKVELLEVRKEEEAIVRRYAAIKPTTTEIEADHMTCHHITCDSIPWTAFLDNKVNCHRLQSLDEWL